jgi:hypothetical protein
MSADDDTVGKPPWRLFPAAAGDLVGAAGATGVLTTPARPAAPLPEPNRADTAPFCSPHQGGMTTPMAHNCVLPRSTSQPWGAL